MTEGPRITQELVDLKNKQRAALRKEYWKQFTNPHGSGGHIFDPAIQRFLSMQVSKIEHFRETPKTVLRGLFILVIPTIATVMVLKNHRDKNEAAYRSGQVAYKDRLFKFV